MPRRHLWRDSKGRFIRNVSPPAPQRITPPSPSPLPNSNRPNQLQRVLAAATPLSSNNPVSQLVSNIATAFQALLPEQDTPDARPHPLLLVLFLHRVPPPNHCSLVPTSTRLGP